MSPKPIFTALIVAAGLASCERSQPARRATAPATEQPTPAVSTAAPPPVTAQPAAPLSNPSGKSPATASLIEPSHNLGGVLPLLQGVFVAEGSECSDPPNAAVRRYDGQGLSGAHTRACRITVLSHSGQAYDIEQSCVDAGEGPAPRTSERATVVIEDNLTFTYKRAAGAQRFHYCAASTFSPDV